MKVEGRWASGVAGALLLLVLAVPVAAQQAAVQGAQLALDAGDAQRAVETLQAAATAAPANAELTSELALARLAAGQHDRALETARAAVSAAPDSAAAARALGLVRAGRFEFPDALNVLNDALARRSTDAGLLAAKGRVLWQLKHTTSAIKALEAAARDGSYAGEAQYWLGRIYLHKGAQSEGAYPGWHEEVGYRPKALEAFKAASRARPGWYAPHIGMGLVLLADGQAKEALAAYDAAIARGATVTGARVGRWRALKALGRDQDIRSEVATAAASSDARLLAAAREGYGLLEMKAEADALTTRLVDEFPTSPAAEMILTNRIGVARRASDHAAVMAQAKAFIAKYPYSTGLTDVYEALVAAYQATPGAPIEDVVAAIDGNIAHRPDPAGYLTGANLLLARRTSLDKAIQLAEAGLSASEAFVNENLEMYKLEGKSSNSIARARSSVADIVGWAHFLKGDLPRAEAKLGEADRLARGQDATNQFHLGELARAKGTLEIAREHYLNALTPAQGPAPLRDAAKKALADVQVKLGNEAAEFDGWFAAEMDRRRETRRAEALRSLVGKPAPDLRLLDVNGKQVDLRAERGNVVLLNFFASW